MGEHPSMSLVGLPSGMCLFIKLKFMEVVLTLCMVKYEYKIHCHELVLPFVNSYFCVGFNPSRGLKYVCRALL